MGPPRGSYSADPFLRIISMLASEQALVGVALVLPDVQAISVYIPVRYSLALGVR